MRVGSVVYATEQGLGYLAKSFYDAGVVTDVVVVSHGRNPNRPEWYPNHPMLFDFNRQKHLLLNLVERVDAMLFFETPFRWELMDYCRKRKVRTFLMTMYECTPERLPSEPDRFLCPSELDLRHFPERSTYLPVPVDGVEWRQRHRLETFVHNAGHGGLRGRNGTRELLEAWVYVTAPASLLVRSQGRLDGWDAGVYPDDVEWGTKALIIQIGTFPRGELYAEGDAFVFPEKFNGLSLPLQEAKAAGMCVIATDRFPNNRWLTVEPSIPVASTRRSRIGPPYREFDEAVVDPRDIAQVINDVYGMDIGRISEAGRAWAASMSWEVLKPYYMEEIARWM